MQILFNFRSIYASTQKRVCLDANLVAANRVVGRSLAHADIRNAFQQLVGEHNVAALAAFDTAKVTDSELHSAQRL